MPSSGTGEGDGVAAASETGVGTAAVSAGVSEMEDSGCTGSVVIALVLSELIPFHKKQNPRSGIPESVRLTSNSGGVITRELLIAETLVSLQLEY